MTPFTLLLQLSGLSQREAADFLGASPSSVDKWARGARTAPDGVLDELRDLIDRQVEAAGQALDLIEEKKMDRVEIGFPAGDDEARALGWPCVGAWKGMAARVVAESGLPTDLVPRGSTVATAAAARQFEGRLKHP
ncbi:hypothetical protein [Polymorphum gilvum]|uniref:Uncharacterized protein n=1 Tax=Polymorphum gilvum (strain LMG 25793 / CGMCC 1.9160 / SL003B-26A1) TaxID=991905 RepID=F2J5N6_POLGS|nr:hypothetical protein [Polymorphum gilvum]ADZ70120.1 hypothetical protein SL003B_1692 [Polymorphum gilvum SL003B-26A1]